MNGWGASSRWGTSYYHVNSNDQIVHAEQKGARPLLELFEYDAALNIIGHQQRRGGDGDVPPERINQTQQAGRVIRRGNGEYRYDSAGRLAEKRTEIPGYRPQVWRYRWDANSQMRGLITPDGEQWHYRYDAFGRRISKRRQEATRSKLAGYDYLWSGGQLIEETPVYADGSPAYEESIHWLYEPGALTPAARRENGQLHYVVSDHMGTPRELLTEKGDVAWASRLSTWGDATRYRLAANDDKLSCNLRFAGQYADEESGLHYNRHRYYDSETGQYLSPDPIGLAGGVNPYGYVANPLKWVDPLGLCKTDNSAHNGADYQRFKDYYTQYEKYGAGGVRELQNGRYRFYDNVKPSRTSGAMKGARLVREWDPTTGSKRTWYETVDHNGNVRSVAPKPVTNEKNHHIFDVDGNYEGRR
jgi:RHS repeat-associated protein